MKRWSDLQPRTARRLRNWGPLFGPLLLLAGTYTFTFVVGGVSVVRTETILLINVVLVVGLYAFVGPTGILSFGHAAFMAVGAYMSALLTFPVVQKAVLLPDLPLALSDVSIPFVPAAFAGAVLAAVVAGAVGVPLMRLNGIQAGIATLALLVISHVVVSQWSAVTKGPGSLTGIPTVVTPELALGFAALAVVLVFLFQRSRVGLSLRAAREDEVAARGIGVKVFPLRVVALLLSGFIVGLGGALYGHYVGVLSPNAVYLQVTFFTVAMLIVGGVRSLTGAVVGATVVSIGAEVLRNAEDGIDVLGISIPGRPGLAEIGVALLLLVILILRPAGLTGGREFGSGAGGPADVETGSARRPLWSAGEDVTRRAPSAVAAQDRT